VKAKRAVASAAAKATSITTTEMRAAALTLLAAAATFLAGCGPSQESEVAAMFFARIDSGKAGQAWDMLVDADKAALGREAFIAFCTDTSRPRDYDTLLETREIGRVSDGVQIQQLRRIPDWDLLQTLRKPGVSLRSLAATLHGGNNLRSLPDSSRIVTVVGQGSAARVSIGAAGQQRYRHALDSLEKTQLALLDGRILRAEPRANIGVWCNAQAEVRSDAAWGLRRIVFDVTWKGRPLGEWRVEAELPPHGHWSGPIGVFYGDGMGPEVLGTVPLPGREFSLKAVAAEPIDPRGLRETARRLSGTQPMELL